MTSSNGNIFRVTGPLCGEFTRTGEFPSQRPVTRSYDVFFDLRLICLNNRLSKRSGRRWFETPAHSLWRHCYGQSWPYDNSRFSVRLNGNAAMLTKFLSLAAPELVTMTTSNTASVENFINMTTFSNLHRLISAAIGRWVTSDPAELPYLPGRKKLCTNAVE